MRFLRDMFKPKEPEQEEARDDTEPTSVTELKARAIGRSDIGVTVPPPDGAHRDEIIVTSNQPLLEQNSKRIDAIVQEEYGGKVTKR